MSGKYYSLQSAYDVLHTRFVGNKYISPKVMEYMLEAHKRDNGGSKLIDVEKYSKEYFDK